MDYKFREILNKHIGNNTTNKNPIVSFQAYYPSSLFMSLFTTEIKSNVFKLICCKYSKYVFA